MTYTAEQSDADEAISHCLSGRPHRHAASCAGAKQLARRQADHDDRALPARRRGRYGGAAGGRDAGARVEVIVDNRAGAGGATGIGAGPALLALLGGQVDAVATGPSTVAQQIRAGKLRALARWGDKPLAALPDVPSLKQSGYATTFAQWSALFVPAGTPDDIVTKLRAAAKQAATDPQVVQTINRAGSPIEYLDAPEFQRYWTADAALMNEAVKKIGKVE